jgi:hypothetical protein
MSGRIGVVSHHLQSLLGVIKLIFLCAIVCKIGYFDAQLGILYLLLKKNVTCFFIWNEIVKQLVFLVISSTPSQEKFEKEFQATHYGRINLFSPFSVYLPCPNK